MKQALVDDEQRRGKSGDIDSVTASGDSALKAVRKFRNKNQRSGTSKCFNCGQRATLLKIVKSLLV